ncbi:MAG: PilN domain-containing protein [Nitrospinaceae bacterium]
MITINLYDYKRIVRDVGIQKQLAMVAAGSMIVLLICCGTWMFQNMWIWNIESNLAEVEIEVAAATPDYNAVKKLKKQQGQYTKIITGIDALRSDQARTTEFLEDMGRAIPEGIWLTSVQQMGMDGIKNKKIPFLFINYDDKKARRGKKGKRKGPVDKFVELKGTAMDGQSIVHLLEQLRAIPYIDAVVLNTSKRKWMENQPVQNFEIYCHFLKTKPAA